MKSYLFAFAFCFTIGLNAQQNNKEIQVEHLNIAYLPQDQIQVDSLQRLNLVLPTQVKKPPLLVWIGGGAWSFVNRHMEMDLARKFADEGIAVAAVGHQLSAATWQDPARNKGVQHPTHALDIVQACKWLIAHADDYGYDAQNIFIGGFSSGAYLASIITMDPSITKAVGLKISDFKGVLPISGTFDIPDYYQTLSNGSRPELGDLHVKAVFGNTQEHFLKASNTSYLENLRIPMLLMTDNALDKYTRLFVEKIEKETDYKDYSVTYVPDLAHAPLWRNLSHEENSPYRAEMIAFIHKYSKPQLAKK